jgi:hypothetical protein
LETSIMTFPFFSNPEEFAAHMQEHANQEHMSYTDSVHKVKDFLDGLDRDGLEALDIILRSVIVQADTAHMVRGQITQIAHKKFDICPCGEDHDPAKEFQTPLLPQQKAPTIPNTATEHGGRPIEDVELPGDETSQERAAREMVEATVLTDEELMSEYGLELDPNYGKPMSEGMMPPQKYRCINCQSGYPSLQDRMLKPPGVIGCSGCQQKGKWG